MKLRSLEIEHLRLQVARFRNLKFGQSSERFEGTVDKLHLGIDQNEVKISPPPRDPHCESDTAEPTPKRKSPFCTWYRRSPAFGFLCVVAIALSVHGQSPCHQLRLNHDRKCVVPVALTNFRLKGETFTA